MRVQLLNAWILRIAMCNIVVVGTMLLAAIVLQSFAMLIASIASAALCVVVLFGLLSYQEYLKLSEVDEKSKSLSNQLGN